MNRRLPVFRLMRSRPASGIAGVVAPSSALGRARSALALTAVLAAVQLGIVVSHATSALCSLTEACRPQAVASGRVLTKPPAALGHGASSATSGSPAGLSGGSAAVGPSSTHTVAFRTPAASPTPSQQEFQVGTIPTSPPQAAAPLTKQHHGHKSTTHVRQTSKLADHCHPQSPQKTRSTTARACRVVRR